MAALTGAELIDIASRGTGDRNTLGGPDTTFDAAALFAANKTIRRIAGAGLWDVLSRQYSSSINNTDWVFSLPSTTNDSTISGIRAMTAAWLEISDVGHRLEQILDRRKLASFPHTDVNTGSARPAYYGRFDRENFWVHPHPDQTYVLHMKCQIYPVDITAADQHPLGEELDLTVIAGMMAILYGQLQQPDDMRVWNKSFDQLLKEQKAFERERVGWTPRAEPQTEMGAEYGRPPNYTTSPWYMRRWR